jgi:hypothetical protein
VVAQRAAALGSDAAKQSRLRVPEGLPAWPVFVNACTAKDDDRGAHAGRSQRLIRLLEFQQEAYSAHRVAQQEILV